MDYFLLKQDERYANIPILIDVVKKFGLLNLERLNAHKVPDTLIFYVQADKETSYLDILDRQLYIVSGRLKKIIAKYVPDTMYKMLPLIDLKHERQETYYLPIIEEIAALSPENEFNLDKSVIQKLVLDAEKIQGHKIFKIKESAKPLVAVRLDVAESILRRGFMGIRLEKILVN